MHQTESLIPVTEAGGAGVATSFPAYDRPSLEHDIGHLGLGNFHRAHQAYFLHRLLEMGAGSWMVQGASMLDRERGYVDDLRSQDNLYTLVERSSAADTARVIGSVREVMHAPSERQRVIDTFSSDAIRIISLTVTEKGYSNTPSGELNAEDAGIRHDLGDVLPTTTLGFLHAIARRRMKSGVSPVTVMSCDNLVGNGDMTERLLLQFSEEKDAAVAEWIRNNMTFPNSMVDRITPATTAETREFVASRFGIADKCPVVCEPYIQWCLEDNFINGRPEFETCGVQMVPSVKPYEVLKMRLLNGSHSSLSYAAYLMGYRKVDEAMADPLVSEFVGRYMEEVTPTLEPIQGTDTEMYKDTLVERFSNPAISDSVDRLALDGSAKIGTYIVPPLADNLRGGGSVACASFALAAWIRYLQGKDEAGKPIVVNDPARDMLQALSHHPESVLATREIFGEELAASQRLRREVSDAYASILRRGTRQALSELLHA